MLTFTFALNSASQSSMLVSKLLAIVAKLFYWDYNISDLVMVHSKVETSGGVASLDDNPGVSLDIRLGLCVKFWKD
jgi:hypothetical protein